MTPTVAKPMSTRSNLNNDEAEVAAHFVKMVAAVGAAQRLQDGSTDVEKEMADEEFAACNFDAWIHEEGEWTPPTNDQWAKLANPHLVTIRIAWLTLYKTKAELIEMLRDQLRDSEDDGNEFITSILDHLSATSDFLNGMLTVVDSALARLLVAGMNIPNSEFDTSFSRDSA